VGGLVSNVWALLIGCVFGGFFLFYILSDWDRVVGWVGSQLPSRHVPGEEIVAAAVDAVRRYFVGLTLSALVTAVVIGGVALLLGIPLWLTIAIITFVTSYVPYLGAVVSGAFATLIALGTEGSQAAVIILIVVLLVQNVLQPVILTNLTSDQLHLHPIVTLAATLIGGTLAGLIGATLAAPAVATALRVRALVSESKTRAAGAAPDGVAPVAAHDGDRPPVAR
jgi:predicted PurR-regulated permease PerM